MMTLRTAACTLTLLLIASTASSAVGQDRIKLEVRLTRTSSAPALASAKAKFESRNDRLKFSTEGEDLAPLNGKTASVYVDGALVGRRRIRAGGFDLNRNSRFGHAVPAVSPGSSVSVRVGNNEIFTGTF